MPSSKGVWEHLEVHRSTGEVTRSVWEDCVWLPDRFTFFLMHPVRCPTTVSSTRPNSLDYGLQVRSITASECISKIARLRPPSASPNSLDYGLQTRSIMASKCITKLARFRPSSLHDHGLQVHLQTQSITGPSVSLNSHDYGFQVHFHTRSLKALECIFQFTRSSFSGAPRIALKQHLQPIQKYRV